MTIVRRVSHTITDHWLVRRAYLWYFRANHQALTRARALHFRNFRLYREYTLRISRKDSRGIGRLTCCQLLSAVAFELTCGLQPRKERRGRDWLAAGHEGDRSRGYFGVGIARRNVYTYIQCIWYGPYRMAVIAFEILFK